MSRVDRLLYAGHAFDQRVKGRRRRHEHLAHRGIIVGEPVLHALCRQQPQRSQDSGLVGRGLVGEHQAFIVNHLLEEFHSLGSIRPTVDGSWKAVTPTY